MPRLVVGTRPGDAFVQSEMSFFVELEALRGLVSRAVAFGYRSFRPPCINFPADPPRLN